MNTFTWEMTKQLIGSMIRHVLSMFVGVLVAREIVSEDLANAWLDEFTAIAVGFVVLMVVAGWKFLNARYNLLTLFTAVQTAPTVNTPTEAAVAVEEVKAEVKANNTAIAPI